MKKIIFTTALLLSFVPAAFAELSSAVPVAAESSDEYIEYDDMTFSFRKDRENELVLDWYIGTDETVIVPETVQGYTVTGINDGAFGYSNDPNWAKYVTLPDSIDFFGAKVFRNSNLVSVNIPKNLKIIPCLTFRRCTNLKTVIFHDQIVGIAENAFERTNIEIPADILVSKCTTIYNSHYDFYEDEEKPFVYPDFSFHFKTDKDTGNLFCSIDGYNGDSTDVIIPEKLRNVPVKYIDLSESGHDKSEITSVTFPVTDYEISVVDNSFSGSMIEKLSMESPCSLGKSAFADCNNLKTVVFDKNAVVGDEAFSRCNSLNIVEFNDGASVGPRSFRECKDLTYVDFNGQVDLEVYAFMDCASLENISLDISQNIPGNAFNGCTSLVDINNKPAFSRSTGDFAPEYSDFIRNNFYMAEDVGFINQYAEFQYKKIVEENTDDSMSDIEKVKILHDWVCEHTRYADNINLPEYHTDASILLNDSTVCEGYSKACNLLFNYAGIESYYIHSSDHAWNIVKLGGHYFHVDSTWDDGENISYNYFLKSDDDIRDDGFHSAWDLYTPTSLHSFQEGNQLPECSYSVGDANMDGVLDVADAVKMASFLLGSRSEKAENTVLYDLNFDGKTDAFDMVLMRKKLITP